MTDEEHGDQDEDPRVVRTRERVHATVLRILGTAGPGAVTHSRVVEESKVSRATIYRHWPDRTALLVDAVAAERPNLDTGSLSGDFRSDLRAFLRAGARALSANDTMPWLLALAMRATEDPEYRVIWDRIRELHDTPLDPLYRLGVSSGALPADLDAEVFQAMCFGPMFVLRFLWRRELDDDVIDAVAATILDGVNPPAT